MTRNPRYLLGLLAVLLLMLPADARAYLDPGAGSYIFQMLIATLMAGLFALKIYWQRVKNFFRGSQSDTPDSTGDSSAADKDPSTREDGRE